MGDQRTTNTAVATTEKNWRKLEYTGPPRAEADCDLEEIQSDLYGNFHFKGTLHCTLPYDAYPQPNLEKIAEMELRVHNWLVKFGLTGVDENEFVKYKQPYTLCSAFTNPQDEVTGDLMLIYYLLFAWLWRVDDQFEKKIKTEEEYLAYLESGHIMRVTSVKILKGEYQNLSDVPPNPTFNRYEQRCEALFDIYAFLCREIKDYHKINYYFLKAWDYYFRGALAVHEEREDISESHFKFLRLHDGGTQMTSEIIAMQRQIVLTKEIRQNLLFKIFKESYLTALTRTNELLGLRTDIKNNEYCNLILLRTKVNGDIYKSCEEILELVNAKIKDTILTAALLRKSFPDNPQLLEYIKLIEFYVDGHVYFYRHCPRYGSVKIRV